MRRLLFLLPLALFVGLALYFGAGLKRDPSYTPSMLIDRPVPEFSLGPIAGKTEGLESGDLKGKVTLVNVFASWCAPCAEEQPVLMAIRKEGVRLVGVNWKDKPGDGARFLARYGDPFERIGDDATGRVAVDFGVTGAPETFVVDEEGRVRHKHVGPITRDLWEGQLGPMVKALEAE
jgi:cytochrome c biogenesis protein CcmG/thiol:disulfide interchange protein DsbE